jgi:hypothetical protein
VLRIATALKNTSPQPGLNPRLSGSSGKHTNHCTTEATSYQRLVVYACVIVADGFVKLLRRPQSVNNAEFKLPLRASAVLTLSSRQRNHVSSSSLSFKSEESQNTK